MNPQPRSLPTSQIISAGLAVMAIAVLIVAVSIGRTPAGAPTPSTPVTADGSGSPASPIPSPSDPAGSPSPAPSADPSAPAPTRAPTATPTPKPTPKPVAWSKPQAVEGLAGCGSVVAAIDERGSTHLAATCDHALKIRYSFSTDGETWVTSTLKPPIGRFELDPQLAFSGDTLYLAYTRVAPADGGCGDDGLDDVGVYYRTRTLPSGAWSAPIRIGNVADHLQAFRVSGSSLFATVMNEKDGSTAFEMVVGGSLERYPIGDAAGGTSLRVGDDGKGRIAYESANGIAYGMVKGTSFSGDAIPGSENGWGPVLLLAPGNDAYLLWNRSQHGGGCVDGGPMPEDGTYFATNESGTWVSRRLTKLVGGASMAMDPATGGLHALVSDYLRLVYLEKAPGSDWVRSTLTTNHPSSPVIRLDPRSGDLFVAYIADEEDSAGGLHVEVMTRH